MQNDFLLNPSPSQCTLRLAQDGPPSISKLWPGLIWIGVEREITLYSRLHVSAGCIVLYWHFVLTTGTIELVRFSNSEERKSNKHRSLVIGHRYAQVSINADLELSTHNDSPLCLNCRTQLFKKRATSSQSNYPGVWTLQKEGLSPP